MPLGILIFLVEKTLLHLSNLTLISQRGICLIRPPEGGSWGHKSLTNFVIVSDEERGDGRGDGVSDPLR